MGLVGRKVGKEDERDSAKGGKDVYRKESFEDGK